jgi:hypothetical protein
MKTGSGDAGASALAKSEDSDAGPEPLDRAAPDAAQPDANPSKPPEVSKPPAVVGCQSGQDCCPDDPNKTAPGACGCGEPDADYDADGLADCVDPAPHGWWRRLTFDGAQVAGALRDFPVLVHVTDAHLGVFAGRDARDVHFIAADSGTVLDYEIERFDADRGDLTAWVRVSQLESGRDVVFYLAYADGREHRPRSDLVWGGHHYVWHLSDELGSREARIWDSTQRAHAGVAGKMTASDSVPGIAGRGIDFDGEDDELVFENDLFGELPSTLQAWVIQRRPASGSLGSAVLMFGDATSDRARFLLSLEQTSGSVRYGFYNNDYGSSAIATDVWRQLVWTWDGRRSSLFINGKLVEGPSPHTDADTRGKAGRIGAFASDNYQFFMSGVLDEVRVSTVARTADWIATEYQNQRPESTFLKSIEAPEPAPR